MKRSERKSRKYAFTLGIIFDKQFVIEFVKFEVFWGKYNRLIYIKCHGGNISLKLTVPQLVKKIIHVYGKQLFVTISQEPFSGSYPEPDESSKHPDTLYVRLILILDLAIYDCVFQVVSSLLVFRLKYWIDICNNVQLNSSSISMFNQKKKSIQKQHLFSEMK
jgi:hypothetical protein